MFGLILNGLAAIGVGLCLRVVKAVYDLTVRKRHPAQVGVDLVLQSVVGSGAGYLVDAILPDVEIPLLGGGTVRVPVKEFAETTASFVASDGLDRLLGGYDLSTLPSGISVASAAVVDLSGQVPQYQGIAAGPLAARSTSSPVATVLPTTRIVLPSKALPHRIVPSRRLETTRIV